MGKKSNKYKNMIPELEGLTLAEAAERLGVTIKTIRQMIYELGTGAVYMDKGKIKVDMELWGAINVEGTHKVTPGVAGHRGKDELYIKNGGLQPTAMPDGFRGNTQEPNFWGMLRSYTRRKEQSARSDLERMVNERGTAGRGEKLG